MIKSRRIVPTLLTLLSLGGCMSVEQVSIDCLQPAEVSFPPELRRVGVVNNVPPQSTLRPELEHPQGPRRPTDPIYFNGNAHVATEALARALAEADYFDEVVICDSALRSGDTALRTTTLSRGEVGKLAQLLDVDVIVSLDNLPMKRTEHVDFDEFEGEDMGTIDLTVYPVVRVYLPGRGAPMATIATSDSIYWEATGRSRDQVRHRLVDLAELTRQGSDFAGTVPLRKLLPRWQTVERSLFDGGSAAMRDATVHVRRGQWDQAMDLWKQAYRDKKGRKSRMRTAFNLALGYEMQDSIDLAIRWIGHADSLATAIYGAEERRDVTPAGVIGHYRRELEGRRTGYYLLDEQMRRFEGE